MHNKIKQVMALIFLSAVVVTQSGCFGLLVGAAAGAGTFAFVNGDLEYNVDASVEQAHSASIRALRKLAVPVKQDVHDQHNAKIKSAYADGKDISISITALTEKSSKIQIRVGVFGDQTRSESILNTIQKYL